ncbi:hypothetical protein LTR93_011981 [Exophiala xenobiotica]|nr:hypothetical protein LTR93_011981 [Exophiala xenobiotica]
MEMNISMLDRANQHVDVGAEIDEDEPRALPRRLLVFVSVNHSYLMPLLFFFYGRLSQEGASQSGDSIAPGKKPLHPRPHMRLLCRRILPAIVCQLSLQRLQRVAIQQANFDTSSYESSTASPIVLFPLLLSAFDFTVSTIVERMGQARAAVYLEQFQAGRRRIVPVYWTMLVQMDTIVAAVFPLNVLSESAFRLTDIPQYFFAYIWGRLSVTTGSIHVMAIFAPISMPILCLAFSVFFSNVALLKLALAIPGLSQRDFLTESVQSSLARMGNGFSQPAIIYRVWKQLSFASIAPALLEIFRQTPDEDIWVTVPGVGRRQLKRYAYVTFLLYLPISKLLQISIDTMSAPPAIRVAVLQYLGFRTGLIAFGVMYGALGALNALMAWMIGCCVIEYIPSAGRIL